MALVAALMAVLGGAVPSPAAAAVGEFQPLKSSSVPLTSVAVDPTTNLIYAQENNGTKFFVYDPRTDEWTERAEAPIESGNNGGATYLNGKIYTVFTGNETEVGVYDIEKNEWSVIPNPLERGTADITAVGGSLYLAEGEKFVKYDPVTEVTTPLAEVPGAGFEPWGGLQPYHGKIYGHQGNGNSSFFIYDIGSDEWTEGPELPEGATAGSALDPVTGTYYAYGNYDERNLYRYDIAANEWTTVELPFEVDDGGMAYVPLRGLTGIYLIQGESGEEFTRYTTAEPQADLALTKSASVASAAVGGGITYTIKVTNNGPDEAQGVTVSDPLPSNVGFVSSSTSQGACSGSSTVVCALGQLASGGTATVTITVKTTSAGTATNTASVLAETVDPKPGDNSASATTTVGSPEPAPLNPARWLVPTGKLPVRTHSWVSAPLQNLNASFTLSGSAQLLSYGREGGTALASNTVFLAGGATKTLYLHLNSAALSKLRARHQFNVQLLLTLHDELGRTVKASGVYLLVGTGTPRHKKHSKK